MRRLLSLLLLLPGLALGQTAVKVYTTDSVTSACVLGALNATCQLSMAGKSSAGFIVTAISTPSNITLVNEASRDGTNWDAHPFIDMDNGGTLTSIPNASLAVGFGKTLITGGGVRYVRVRASTWTSGSVTVAVTGTDTISMPTTQTMEVTDGAGQPTAAGNQLFRAPIATTDGRQYVNLGGPVLFRCSLNAIAATLTQCQAAAAAGLSHYISWMFWQSTTTTAGTGALQSGTGTNCGTGTTAILPASATGNRYGYPASSASGGAGWFFWPVPIKLTAAHALCVIGVATNTVRVDIGGFTAP